MTTPARQPQHCDHECVCRHHDFEEMEDAPCYLKVGSCRCDTRTHTIAQAPDNLVWMTSEEEEKRIRKAAREQYAEDLKKDLKSRFVSQSNQWCKGRNSGLIECCNIIDESLRQQGNNNRMEQ
jgi:hypothetical protein